jgi:hypothetical protein
MIYLLKKRAASLELRIGPGVCTVVHCRVPWVTVSEQEGGGPMTLLKAVINFTQNFSKTVPTLLIFFMPYNISIFDRQVFF